jgi:nuclear pore complex protein Nup210
VFVNRINRIEITTTTRELLLGQSPELLDVIAFDDTGNLFSSLDGLAFDWELITVKGSIEASSVLR